MRFVRLPCTGHPRCACDCRALRTNIRGRKMLSVVIPAAEGVPRLRCALICLAAAIRNLERDVEVVVVNDGGGTAVRQCVEAVRSTSDVEINLIEIPRSGR